MGHPFIWLLVSIFFYAYGEYLSKIWAFRPTFWMTCWVIFIYAMGGVGWLPAIYQRNEIAVMGTLWVVLATISTVIVGTGILHEPLSWSQWIGVVLAVISCVLIAK